MAHSPYIVGDAMLSSGRGISGVIVRGIEPDNPVIQDKWSHYLTQGSFARLMGSYPFSPPGSSGPPLNVGGVAVGSGLAEKLKVTVGNPVRMVAPLISADGSLSTRTGDFVVGAVFESGLDFTDTKLVLMDLPHAQEFFGRGDKVDGIEVHLANLDETLAVSAALRQAWGVRTTFATGFSSTSRHRRICDAEAGVFAGAVMLIVSPRSTWRRP